MINKDTLLFGSFGENAGNVGCKMFNTLFEEYNINAIYKSFSVNNIEKAVLSAKTLNFKGFGVSMPFKTEVLTYVDDISEVEFIGSANTIVNNDGLLKAYNTDYLSSLFYLKDFKEKNDIFILGNGGYSKAVQLSAKELELNVHLITRKNWSYIKELKNSLIFNCTPVSDIVVDNTNEFIDCLVNTNTGYKLAIIQGLEQFKLYTKIEVSYEYFSRYISKGW